MKLISRTEEETQQIGEKCGVFLEKYIAQHKTPVLVTLQGELGSGKTVFSRGVLKAFGIIPHGASPTFVLMKRYTPQHESVVSHIIHIDAYRLDKETNIDAIGFNDLTKEDAIILIEWPEHISYTPDIPHLMVVCEHGEDETIRYIDIRKPQ